VPDRSKPGTFGECWTPPN